MEYLKNDICKFEIITPFDINEKKNLMVTSLFKMSTGGYKDFQLYVDGISVLNNHAKNHNMYVRLFIDDTIYKDHVLMEKFSKLERVQMVLYKCNNLIINGHHIGVVGTLLRFFPLFDFENNDANFVITSDADTKASHYSHKTTVKIYDSIQTQSFAKDLHLVYAGMYSISVDVNIRHIHKGIEYCFPYCMAATIVGIKKIPKEVLLKFLIKLTKYVTDNPPKKILSNHYKNLSVIPPNKIKIVCENNVCLGVDEYFTNNKLLKYLLVNDLPFGYRYRFSYSYIFFDLLSKSSMLLPSGPQYAYIKKKYLHMLNIQGNPRKLLKDVNIKNPKDINIKANSKMVDIKNKIKKLIINMHHAKDFRLFKPYFYYMFFDNEYDKYFSVEQIRFINYVRPRIILSSIIL